MGGIGSGTHTRWGTRDTVDDMKALHIGKLATNRFLHSGGSCTYGWSQGGRRIGEIHITTSPGRVTLDYRRQARGGDWQAVRYPVQSDRTPCHLGGTRPWFLCPARGCGRRVAVLYGGAVFACRQCQRLAYPSENENLRDRATRKAEKLRKRLGWPDGILSGSDHGRPKYMHRATYHRLVAAYDAQEAQALGHVKAWLNCWR